MTKIHNPHPWHKQNRVDGKTARPSKIKREDIYEDAAESEGGRPADVDEESFKARFGLESVKGLHYLALEHVWRVLQTLPKAHVTHDRLKKFVQKDLGDAHGSYDASKNKIAINYRFDMEHDTDENKEDKNTSEGDALHGAHILDSTTKHEIGHSVDEKYGYSKHFNPAGWQEPGEDHIAGLLVERYAQCEDPTQKAKIQTLLAILMERVIANYNYALLWNIANQLEEGDDDTDADRNYRSRLEHALEALDIPTTGQARNEKLMELVDQEKELFAAYYFASSEYEAKNYGTQERLRFGDRYYQLCADGKWRSYLAADRARKKVSSYQYASPSEWFAEQYAAYYYSPDTRAWLEQNDSYVYNFFKDYVDKGLPPPENLAAGRPD